MVDHKPFSVVRLRRGRRDARGPDRPDDLFSVRAEANASLVDSKESPPFALLNGMMSTGDTRAEAQRLADALNMAWTNFYQ